MSQKTFLIIRIITAMALAIVVSVFITQGNWYLPVTAVLAAFVFLLLTKKKVKGVIADERDYKIAGKASYMAMTIYTILAVIAGLIIFAKSKENESLMLISNILLYSVCLLMILYSVLFKIYVKRSGN